MAQQPRQKTKLDRIKALCLDLDLRDATFNSPRVQTVLSILSVRGFNMKYLQGCPAFDLEQSLVTFSYQREVFTGKKRIKDTSELTITPSTQLRLLSNYLEGSSIREVVVDPDAQEEDSKGVLRNLSYRDNNVLIFSGVTDYQKARFLVFMVLLTKLLDKTNDNHLDRPIWHYCFGGYKDELRDNEDFRYRMGTTNYLVLDNLDGRSTEAKLEKYKDLMSLYPHTDIFILGAGLSPLDICSKVLNVGMHSGIYFDEGLVLV